jgi:predicted N-acetyltransferase YhbS
MIKVITFLFFLFFIFLSVLVLVEFVTKKYNQVKNDYKNNAKNNSRKKIYTNKPTDRVNQIKQLQNYAIANNSIVQKCFSKRELKTFNKYKKLSNRFIYKEGNIIKGEIWFTPSHYIEELPQITLEGYYINNLCVIKKYRKRGIGRKLIEWVINRARDEGKLHIILQVDSNKSYLVNYYRKLGFNTYMKGIEPYSKNITEIMFLGL